LSLRGCTPSICLIDTAYLIGNARILQFAAVSSGPEQMQMISAACTYLRMLYSIACSVHSLPRFPVPKVPKTAIFGRLELELIGDILSDDSVWFSTTVVVSFIASARKVSDRAYAPVQWRFRKATLRTRVNTHMIVYINMDAGCCSSI
jgi:hypothetical protein